VWRAPLSMAIQLNPRGSESPCESIRHC
jgi:hypothetical protein